jgi:hypothetical protein
MTVCEVGNPLFNSEGNVAEAGVSRAGGAGLDIVVAIIWIWKMTRSYYWE